MELMPSEPQRFAAELRTSGAMEAEVRAVPLTLLQTLSDCVEAVAGGLILGEDGFWICAKHGAPAESDGGGAGQMVRGDGAGGAAGNAAGLADVGDDLVEGVALGGDDGPEGEEERHCDGCELAKRGLHGVSFQRQDHSDSRCISR